MSDDTDYPHDGRANNASYRHDRRADIYRYCDTLAWVAPDPFVTVQESISDMVYMGP